MTKIIDFEKEKKRILRERAIKENSNVIEFIPKPKDKE